MAAITAALIKQVREDTGAGMLDVKKALTEAEATSPAPRKSSAPRVSPQPASVKAARLRKAPSPPRSSRPPMARPATPSS